MGFMRAELAAIRAGMFALQRVLEARLAARDTITVPSLVAAVEDLVAGIEDRRRGDGSFVPIDIHEICKIERLMKREGKGVCPFCDCEETEGDEYKAEEDCVVENMQCVSCEETWDNHYVLVEQYKL